MDGITFCKKTVTFYLNKNSFYEESKIDIEFKPYLVACSANVTQEIEAEALGSGFDAITIQPLN